MKTVGVREGMPSSPTVMRVSKEGRGPKSSGLFQQKSAKSIGGLASSGGCLWDLHRYIHFA